MPRKKQPLFATKIHENNQNYEYLGSDGLPIQESYDLYLKKCSAFIAKAKNYKKDNDNIKNSLLHHVKYGYENTESLDEEILNEREKQWYEYRKAFSIMNFQKDENGLYENIKGQSKRIRIIRDLDEEKVSEDFTENFYKGTKTWFTRYCTLSKFVQVARMVIILNRLKKNLEVLRNLTPEDVTKYAMDDNFEQQTPNEISPPVFLPCSFCPEDNQDTM